MVSNLVHGIFENFVGLLLSFTQTQLHSRILLTQALCFRKSCNIFYNEIVPLKRVLCPVYYVCYHTVESSKYSAVQKILCAIEMRKFYHIIA